jgi:hypothetical protein
MGIFGKTDEKIGANSPVNNEWFHDGDIGTDNLANNHAQHFEFYHLPSDYFVMFKAFITRYSDDFRSEWKKTKVYGRMDDIATFVNTSRSISVGFKTVAASVQEAEQNMVRVSLLIQMLYPSYDVAKESGLSTIKGSPLFKIKFLNWIKGTSANSLGAEEGKSNLGSGNAKSSGLMGYLEGVSFDPDLESGVFQAGLEIYPKVIDLNLTFNVIHEHPLGWKPTNKATDYLANPQTSRFPYGRNTRFDADNYEQSYNAISEKQLATTKRLQAAQKKLITG